MSSQLVKGNDSKKSGVNSEKNNFDLLHFHEGLALNLSMANTISTENPTQVIILAGASESGKTTLLASIYDKFSSEGVGDFYFAGSLTLPGFEQRCHLARIASGRIIAETERTKAKNEIDLLHLRVSRKSQPTNHIHLLLSDISGETFRLIKDSVTESKKYQILSRCDHFAVLIDGAHIISKTNRHKAFSDCRSLLRSVFDGGMVGKSTIIDIIFSKWDLVEPTKEKNDDSIFVESIEKKLLDEFNGSFARINFIKIAARPKNQVNYSFGYNLDKLFYLFVTDHHDKNLSLINSVEVESLSEMDKFTNFFNHNKGIDND